MNIYMRFEAQVMAIKLGSWATSCLILMIPENFDLE